jgi:hypothetical protein
MHKIFRIYLKIHCQNYQDNHYQVIFFPFIQISKSHITYIYT